MIEKPPLSEHLIARCLNTDYRIEVAKLTLLPLGADMDASVYEAQAQNRSSFFVKVKHGHHDDISVAIQKLCRDSGIMHTITPIKTTRGESMAYIHNFTLIVYPFIKGENGFNRNLTDTQWIQLGGALRRLHEITVPQSIQNRIRVEDFSPKWRDAVRTILDKIETKPNTDEPGIQLWSFINANIKIIRRLLDNAEKLTQKLQKHSLKFVLCHSDIHGGNVLIDATGTLYIVDWDDPIMAPKERDLMFIGGGVANVWNNPSEEVLFYEGYGPCEIDSTLLAYYRHNRILEDIALYAQNLLFTATGGEKRHEVYKHFIDMFAPRGVVDIALTTENNCP